MKYFKIILLVLGVGAVVGISWYANKQQKESRFAVYLVENNKIVFSDKEIVSYDPEQQYFTLTQEGVKKVTALDVFLETPDGGDIEGLYQKPFIAKLGSKELYRGKFWSNLSSGSEKGIVITDPNMISSDWPKLSVGVGYPGGDLSVDQQQINPPELLVHFKKLGKLEPRLETKINAFLESNTKGSFPPSDHYLCSNFLYGYDDKYLYTWAYCAGFIIRDDGQTEDMSGFSAPVRLEYSEPNFRITDHKLPGDGAYYTSSIKELFPKEYQERAITGPSKDEFLTLRREVRNKLEANIGYKVQMEFEQDWQ